MILSGNTLCCYSLCFICSSQIAGSILLYGECRVEVMTCMHRYDKVDPPDKKVAVELSETLMTYAL